MIHWVPPEMGRYLGSKIIDANVKKKNTHYKSVPPYSEQFPLHLFNDWETVCIVVACDSGDLCTFAVGTISEVVKKYCLLTKNHSFFFSFRVVPRGPVSPGSSINSNSSSSLRKWPSVPSHDTANGQLSPARFVTRVCNVKCMNCVSLSKYTCLWRI